MFVNIEFSCILQMLTFLIYFTQVKSSVVLSGICLNTKVYKEKSDIKKTNLLIFKRFSFKFVDLLMLSLNINFKFLCYNKKIKLLKF